MSRQNSFNSFDQLWNVDWFGKEWMPIDMKASLRLGSRDKRSEEDDGCVVQFRVSADLCRNFASVPVGHDYIKEDQIRPKIPRGLVGPGGIVFFEHHIAACLFEKNFDQMSRVFVVINNQNPSRGITN